MFLRGCSEDGSFPSHPPQVLGEKLASRPQPRPARVSSSEDGPKNLSFKQTALGILTHTELLRIIQVGLFMFASHSAISLSGPGHYAQAPRDETDRKQVLGSLLRKIPCFRPKAGLLYDQMQPGVRLIGSLDLNFKLFSLQKNKLEISYY